MVLAFTLLACQQDLLLAMGDLTGVSHDGRTVMLQMPPAPEPAVPASAPAEAEGSEEGFNPISVPEGARASGGASWDGVRTKGVNSSGGPRGGRLSDL